MLAVYQMYSRAWAVVFIIYIRCVWRYLFRIMAAVPHAFILFIGVVWGLSAPDIHDEKYYICLMWQLFCACSVLPVHQAGKYPICKKLNEGFGTLL